MEGIVEHKIIIDDNMSATLNIPKELTAIELKALMHKANKLFNLSETTISNKNLRGNYKRLSNEEKKEMVTQYDKGKEAREKLCQKYKITMDALNKKIYYLKGKQGY